MSNDKALSLYSGRNVPESLAAINAQINLAQMPLVLYFQQKTLR